MVWFIELCEEHRVTIIIHQIIVLMLLWKCHILLIHL